MDTILVTLDAEAVSLDALQRAAYALADQASADIRRGPDGWSCELFPRAGTDPDDLLHRFRIEVVDQELRIRIAAQTEGVRNIVLSLAMSRTGLVETGE